MEGASLRHQDDGGKVCANEGHVDRGWCGSFPPPPAQLQCYSQHIRILFSQLIFKFSLGRRRSLVNQTPDKSPIAFSLSETT